MGRLLVSDSGFFSGREHLGLFLGSFLHFRNERWRSEAYAFLGNFETFGSEPDGSG